MPELQKTNNCRQCNSQLLGDFCANCGAPQQLKRIDSSFIFSEIGSIFNFQKGILFTVKELLIRPGISVKKFIQEDRKQLVKPISFIILCSLIYTVLQKWLLFEDGYINYSELDWGKSTVKTIMSWITNNYGFSNLLMANFMAIWIKIFFRKYDYNIFEILILLYFVMGIQMLLFSFFGSIESLIGVNILNKVSSLVIGYVCWAIGRFFDGRKKINYLKALFSYLLGLISFIITAFALGGLIDWLL